MTENRDRSEMACPYFLLSRYDFSCLRQRRLESDAEDSRRDCRCRRNHSSLPQRKLESDADTVETTNSVGKPCSDSQIDPPQIKNQCTQEGVNGEKITSILKSGPEITNRCTQEGLNGEKLTSILKFGPEIKNRCSLWAVSWEKLAVIPKLTP